MSASQNFQVGRSARTHSHGVVARVSRVFGTTRFVWETDQGKTWTALQDEYPSQIAAQVAADDRVVACGHLCDGGCAPWRDVD